MVVAETNGTQCSESKVNHDNSIFFIGILVEFELLDKTNMLLAIELVLWNESEIAEDVPEHSHEITDGDNNDNKFEGLEEVGDH